MEQDVYKGTPMGKKSDEIIAMLQKLGNSEIALHSRRFFKTGPGEYGKGTDSSA